MKRSFFKISKKLLAAGISAALTAGGLVTAGGFPGDTVIPSSALSVCAAAAYSASSDGEHAVTADGKSVTVSGATVTKTGNASSEEADFSGDNAAMLAENGGTLTVSNSTVTTAGSHANGIFSYGTGTTVNVSSTSITTTGSNSGGIMTTGGGTMNASNLTVNTSGNSSAAIRSDRGGGTVTVNGGTYTTSGSGSPAIYSTADITVKNASLKSTAAEGIVVEGANSVTLRNTSVSASNTVLNGKAATYQTVMLYQSMSGDAADGGSSFSMTGGTMTSGNGNVFYVTNTNASITLNGAKIVNAGGGALLSAAAGPWGSSGSNGGNVTFSMKNETLSGNISIDSSSAMNLYLSNTDYTGAISGGGSIYVEVPEGSTWTLTGDSAVTSLTAAAGSINLNGHTLTVNGTAYRSGTASTGEAVTFPERSGGMGMGEMPPDMNGGMGSRPGTWQSDSIGWWYRYEDGSYPVSSWENIRGIWYYFNEDGYMQTGWLQDDGAWYFLAPEGELVTNSWIPCGSSWYYAGNSGALVSDCWVGGFYINRDGSWTYRPTASWYQDSTGWYYEDTAGWYPVSVWQLIDGVWYEFDEKGYLKA